MLDLVPSARVAHIGIYRDPETLKAVEYYFKAPEDVAERLVIVLDPMLATANSAVAAVDRLKEAGAKDIASSACSPRPRASRISTATSRRAHLDRRDRQPPERSRLYRAGPWRCGRPHVRDEVTGASSGRPAGACKRWIPRHCLCPSKRDFRRASGVRPSLTGYASVCRR